MRAVTSTYHMHGRFLDLSFVSCNGDLVLDLLLGSLDCVVLHKLLLICVVLVVSN
jgi:hypothetical protein